MSDSVQPRKTAAHQAPLSTGFSRQEYWSGLPLPSPIYLSVCVCMCVCVCVDPSWIPGLGRSPGEWIGYPLQYSWASLVTQLVKNPPAMQETWVRSLGWEDALWKGTATHSSYSGLENLMDCTVLGVTKSWTRLSDLHFHFSL